MKTKTQYKIVKPPKKLKRFSKMTKAQKRVAVAKDVLLQIDCGKYLMRTGTWVSRNLADRDHRINHEVLTKSEVRCQCCGIGAAILSTIRLFNSYDDVDRRIGFESVPVFTRLFTLSQRRLIEIAFENGWGLHKPIQSNEHSAVEFGKSFLASEDRATAIFRNIVKNKGTFKPITT